MGPNDTIHALATAPGRAGIAVVRISGPEAAVVLRALGGSLPEHRASRVTTLRDRAGAVLDHALVMYFREGGSFTGETVVELHLHGSVAGVRLVLAALGDIGLSRMAEPGEFTRRALENDRLDLTQVQGLADVIDAETEAQHRQAMRVFEGALSEKVGAWRMDLVRARALTEAVIDFADEDVPEDVSAEVLQLVTKVRRSVEEEYAGTKAAERIRRGFTVAIMGEPNVGKSTLLNALTRSDAAIVSNLAGTTRDIVEVRMNLAGQAVTFLDTAGLRDTDDSIEKMGIERALIRGRAADLRLFLYQGDTVPDWPLEVGAGDIVMRSKSDLAAGSSGISALTGQGIPELIDRIGRICADGAGDAGLVSRERDRVSLQQALNGLRRLEENLESLPDEIVALSLREIVRSLQELIGGVDIDAILDEVFSSFCLGK